MEKEYCHHQRKLARHLRRQQTPAEQHLWGYLRKRQMNGVRFRRQACVGRYIADFICFEVKVVIELDGGIHHEQQEYDQLRDDWFRCQGFHVLRFWNEQVLDDTENTLQTIRQALPHHSHTRG